jgi:hypothetical protein
MMPAARHISYVYVNPVHLNRLKILMWKLRVELSGWRVYVLARKGRLSCPSRCRLPASQTPVGMAVNASSGAVFLSPAIHAKGK